ncbi:MAG: hypothetical protein ACI8ZN_000623 [Bacteroidia bacterium]|jgi:hypothetical protein
MLNFKLKLKLLFLGRLCRQPTLRFDRYSTYIAHDEFSLLPKQA